MAEGKFKPRHPEKYKGNSERIFWRSRWEMKFMMYLDASPDVVQWSSEEIIIPYESPLDRKWHRYFPDFWVRLKNGETYIAEVKPLYQTVPPVKKGKRITKGFLNEVNTYAVNYKKWEAARAYCAKKGWEFKILTEVELNIPVRGNGKR